MRTSVFINEEHDIKHHMKWADKEKHKHINFDEWSCCTTIVNSETNFKAYRFVYEYSELQRFATCPFQV